MRRVLFRLVIPGKTWHNRDNDAERMSAMTKDYIKKYYLDEGRNCAESTLRAANEAYALGLEEKDFLLLRGFGGGMAVGGPCGALTGAVAALGRMFGDKLDKEGLHALVAGYIAAFEQRFGSVNCSELTPGWKKEDVRCYELVAAAAALLDETVKAAGEK